MAKRISTHKMEEDDANIVGSPQAKEATGRKDASRAELSAKHVVGCQTGSTRCLCLSYIQVGSVEIPEEIEGVSKKSLLDSFFKVSPFFLPINVTYDLDWSKKYNFN